MVVILWASFQKSNPKLSNKKRNNNNLTLNQVHETKKKVRILKNGEEKK